MQMTLGSRPPRPWGKLSPKGAPTAWHPLIDHCVDVAVCAEQLLLSTKLNERLAALEGRRRLDRTTVARLAVLAGLHDIGKAGHGFQNKVLPDLPTSGHVGEGLTLLTHYMRKPFGLVARRELLQSWGADEEDPFLLYRAAVCHHGRFVESSPLAEWMWQDAPHHKPIETLTELWEYLLEAFPDSCSTESDGLPKSFDFAHGFAGLIMLADWIGSDTDAFPYTEEGDGHRIIKARPAAQNALRKLGLDASDCIAELLRRPTGFTAWTGLPSPRAAQRPMTTHPLSQEGSIAVLEAETGSGKTEAAWVWFTRLMAGGLVDGLMFALPTRAASTQLHGRVVNLAKTTYGNEHPPVVLAVPGYLQVDEVKGRKLAGFEVLWPDEKAAQNRWRFWSAENSKRYLASPIAVGTIDQVLFSVLRVNHAHLRNTSLLRQLLVVDEVHASDAYMTRLLELILARHIQAGGHALLLSATLGSRARVRYAGLSRPRRRNRAVLSLREALEVPYPLLTVAQKGHEPVTVALEADESRIKQVRITPVRMAAEPDDIALRAVQAARQGARVLIIRNTVVGCQAVFESVERLDAAHLLRCNSVCTPHHSRYAVEDRKRLDRALERALVPAKYRRGDRPGVIAVTTQTAEQSLDIDADLLITDLCPVDVLLQRIGRLHRHEDSQRPVMFAEAQVELLLPDSGDLSEHLRLGRGPHGYGTVYSDLRILQATWNLVGAGTQWAIPTDNRALVENATHPEVLESINQLSPEWRNHGVGIEGTSATHRAAAETVSIDYTTDPVAYRDEEGNISTRLGLDSRRVSLEVAARGPFGYDVRHFNLPGYWTRDFPEELDPVEAHVAADGLSFIIAGNTFVYTRLGLRKL